MSLAFSAARHALSPFGTEFAYRTRLVLFAVYALVNARFVLTSLSSGDPRERVAIMAWLLVCIGLVARRSLELILASLALAPVVSYLGLLGWSFGVAGGFLPFACASLVWIGHRLATRPRDLAEPPRLAWVADCLGLVIVVKSAIALMTPSLQNSVWRLATLPSDYPYSEMQAMNVGFYLSSMLCLFGILTLELRVDGQGRALARLGSVMLLQLGVVTVLALAQAVLGTPALVRDGLHAPFVGIHEMGFYAACWTTFFVVATLKAPTSVGPSGLAGLAAAAALLGASFSRTGWIVTLAVVLVFAIVAWRRASRVFLAASALAVAAAVLAAAGVSAAAAHPSERHQQGGWLPDAANRERLSVFAKAVVLAAQRPLDGVGIGDFRITDDARTLSFVSWLDPGARRDHDAHNIVLNLASEAGFGAAALFVVLAGGTALVGVAQAIGGRSIGDAAAAAVTAGLVFNLVNCVITWPWQALTYGALLALPLAHAQPGLALASEPALAQAERVPEAASRADWSGFLPLLPAMIAVSLSPWSVRQDDSLQQARYGFLRWDWFPPGPAYVVCQPSCRVLVETAGSVAAVRVKPIPGLPRSGQLRLTLKLNGSSVASDVIVPPQGIVVPVPGRVGQSVNLELSTRHLWKSWALGLSTSDVWAVHLLDAGGTTLAAHEGPRVPRSSSLRYVLPERLSCATPPGTLLPKQGRLSCAAV